MISSGSPESRTARFLAEHPEARALSAVPRKSSPPPATIPGGQAGEIIGRELAALVQLARQPEDTRRVEEAPHGGEGVRATSHETKHPVSFEHAETA